MGVSSCRDFARITRNTEWGTIRSSDARLIVFDVALLAGSGWPGRWTPMVAFVNDATSIGIGSCVYLSVTGCEKITGTVRFSERQEYGERQRNQRWRFCVLIHSGLGAVS